MSQIEAESEIISIVSTQTFQEVEESLRCVTLQGDPIPGFHPYLKSRISLAVVPLDLLHPCALYVLRAKLDFARSLRQALLTLGHDTLNLTQNAALVEFAFGKNKPNVISPPVVECSLDDNGIYIVADGLHRVSLARKLGLETITVLLIENAAAPLPILPVGWDEVIPCDAVPPLALKRRFRFQSPFELAQWVFANQKRFVKGFADYDDYRAGLELFARIPAP